MNYYQKSIKNITEELAVNIENWLNDKQIQDRQEKYWLNTLKNENKISAWKVFFSQFKSFLILILIIAAVISFFVWEMVDSIVIVLIVILNSILGFIQEYKAEKSIESLKKMSSLKSRVIRNGKEILIDSQYLTVWDILVFDAGDKIWADARIIYSMSAEIAEAVLTWESMPVSKKIDTITNKSALWDQKNMIFAGTIVTKWHGKAVVTSIGMQTEIGKIAGMIQQAPEKQTNLQKDLNKLSKRLWIVILIICGIIFISDVIFVWDPVQEAFLVAIALSVAAIPEWLPAVVTISLWLGVKRLVKKNALMRKLGSVETLWSVNIICTDKTWTLTKNEMTVKNIFVDDCVIDLEWVGYQDFWNSDLLSKNKLQKNSLEQILRIWLLCNNSNLDWWNVIGDPTEVALLVSALKWWLDRKKEEKMYDLIDEIPFDSDRKIMTTVRECKFPLNSIGKWDGNLYLFSKWAPEILIDKCTHILLNGEVKILTKKDKNKILEQNKKFAESAMRVLWFAYKMTESKKWDVINLENGLIFVGLQAMIDPPRVEVRDSIKTCRTAWIRVVMITGDNVLTAKAIAKELWIEWLAMDWIELDKIDDDNLKKIIDNVWVFARVNPSHKKRIVKLLKSNGNVVAMTWDWVNDAPALKYADIGLAMWITWTDVTKEASDMILLDDNFATIVNAIHEWRAIYSNIKKFVNFLLSTNFAEILIIFASVLFGLPLPLIAIQILWINLVTDGLPALALGVDPVDPNIMSYWPRKSGSKIVDKAMIKNILILSSIMSAGCLVFFLRHYSQDVVAARTGVFMLLVLLEMLAIQIIRSDYGVKFWSNKWLFGAIWLSVALVFLVIYIPFFAEVFQTEPLTWIMRIEFLVIIIVTIIISTIMNKIKKLQKIKK